ncbi:hypothetical protein CP532_2712 [Ophiocordyceps camponoti-leonardi (nom. inval.)]|nr:hypothetical protein CP532_2712 [Ophiocordyceps camponoti-leonardi (nom. inval.)]
MKDDVAKYYLAIFGGQGSFSAFSPHSAAIAKHNAQTTPVGNILLSRCHAAFLAEISSLSNESRKLLSLDILSFGSPDNLLKPAEQYHTHPVIQATTLYLCQLLGYLNEALRLHTSYEQSFEKLQATAGFSSGIIPAAVVALSHNLDEFVGFGVEGLRLAFWIACRSHFLCLETAKHTETQVDEIKNSDATFSLVTRGLSLAQVKQRLSQFSDEAQIKDFYGLSLGISISAISKSATISLSGPRAALGAVQVQLQSDHKVKATFTNVHAWYHGGEQLEGVVTNVLEDLRRRDVSFQCRSLSVKPIYSTLDGTLFNASAVSTDDIAVFLTRHLLIHCVHWTLTAEKIADDVLSLLKEQPSATVNITSFGPSSSSLFPEFNHPDPRLRLMDLSPFKADRAPTSLLNNQEKDVAIVGMGFRLPKGKDIGQLWDTISQGLTAVQDVPQSRFKVSQLLSADSSRGRSISITHGAFLDNPFLFDNSFFNISPREAKAMDPQQRLLLHVAQEAFEDAGYVPDSSPSFQRATTGCYIGLATGDYTANLRNNIDAFYSCGTLRTFCSGRISYFYRLSGPSMVTDTACSSSVVSIYHACRALQNGDCTTAIAGGVNVITSPDMYLGLAQGHFLSPTGGCKPFDAAADGYCRAEGCALFVLKRLSDAVAEGDRIHGVIKNALVNNSGNSASITHPHAQTQAELLRNLLKQSGVDPGSVSVIEAHGTGTQAGDKQEIEALRSVFEQHHSAANPLSVTSIKGNIGHCEAASGAASLVKLLLMFRKKEIPFQTGLGSINPSLGDLRSSGILIPRRTERWHRRKTTPRRAVLSNFGASGSNAALLVEEWDCGSRTTGSRHKVSDGDIERSAYVFALSAKSEIALQSSINRHIQLLDREESRPPVRDVCYTATARRQHFDYRLSFACSSIDGLLTTLKSLHDKTFTSASNVTAMVFMFTGQGALYSGMGQELIRTYRSFRDIIVDCDRIVQGLGLACPSILDFMLKEDYEEAEELTDVAYMIVSQCACVALEYGLARMLISWGVVPDYVVGHSLGEFAALCVSGSLTAEETFRVVASRAKMIGENCLATSSGMVACHLSPEETREVISQDSSLSQLAIACFNGPNDCVVGGPQAHLDAFQGYCQSRLIKTKQLKVPVAYHTAAMDPVLESLRELGLSIRVKRPSIPVMTNVYGQLVGDETPADYFALHARQPVRFADSISSLQSTVGKKSHGQAVFLEVGPHPLLLPILQNSIFSGHCTFLGTLKKGQDAWESISETLASLFLVKSAINWRKIFSGTLATVTSLPGHLLEGKEFLIPYSEPQSALDSPESASLSRTQTGLRLLPWLITCESSKKGLVLETDMTILGPLISGHKVGGVPICPASVFHELAIEATQYQLKVPKTQVLIVGEMRFISPLVLPPSPQEATPVMVRVSVTRPEGSSSTIAASFEITSSCRDSSTLHCSGVVSAEDVDVKKSRWAKDKALVARQNNQFSGTIETGTSTFQAKVLYEAVFTRVVDYSPTYRSLSFLQVADSNLEGIGSFRMPSSSDSPSGYLVHPVFTDTLLHAAGFIANLGLGTEQIAICSRVESIEIVYNDLQYEDSFKVYCSLLSIDDIIHADSIALDGSGEVAAVIRGMEFRKLPLANFRHNLSRLPTVASVGSPASVSSLQEVNSIRHVSTSSSRTEIRSGSESPVELSQALKRVVIEVGAFTESELDFTKSLCSLGIDSLMQIEITSKLVQVLPGLDNLRHHALSECDTLQEIEDVLSSHLRSFPGLQLDTDVVNEQEGEATTAGGTTRQSSSRSPMTWDGSDSSNNSPRTLNSDMLPVLLHDYCGSRAPLYLFHDGSGQIDMYARLSGHDRKTGAFFDPLFGSGSKDRQFFGSVELMAKHYVSTILTNAKPQSPYLILGGWSFGGVLAFEAAQQLRARGLDVKGLVLIDSPSPINHEPLPSAVISNITKTMGSQQKQDRSRSRNAIEEEFVSNAALLENYNPRPFSQTDSGIKTVMLQSQETLDTESLWNVRCDWLSQEMTRASSVAAWEELVGRHVKVLPIPGNHFEPFLKRNTSAQLWKACQYIESD